MGGVRAYGFVRQCGVFACFVVAIGVVCAPRLLFNRWGVGARLLCECVIWGVRLIVTGFHVGVRGKAAGRVVRCSAKPGGCRLVGADGEPTPHFSSLSEGEAFLAEREAAQRGGFTAGAGDGEAKTAALTECGDGSGLAVDAVGRWYRDGVLVEDMVEAVSDEGEPVMLTDEDFCGSVVSNAETDVRIHAGRIDDLINIGCYSNYDDGMNMSMIGGNATIERAFGVSVGYVGDDAHVGLLTGHRGPGDDSPFGVLSQVDDMRDRAVIDTVSGDTRIFGMMHESRIGVLTGGASVDEMSGESRIDVVASGGGVDYMLGDSRVGKVRGRASMMRDSSHVDYVMDGGFVEEVHDDASVDSVTFRGRVKGVYGNGRVALVDAGGVVEHVSGSARVGSVDSGGRVNKVDGKGAAVMNVGSGGRVGAVTDGGVVVDVGISDATEPCVVESVDSSSKVSLIDCWADVTYECGESNVSPARAREFVVKRLSDDATGIGGECLARANGDNPYSRSNVRLRVRDAGGRVVDVPDVDGVLRELVEVDDDERELMWESMMGSPDSK